MTATSFLNRRRTQRAARAIALRSSRAYTPSIYLVGGLRDRLPEATEQHISTWFVLLAMAVAFAVGYVVADDRRVEQLMTLCAGSMAPACGADQVTPATTAFNSQ